MNVSSIIAGAFHWPGLLAMEITVLVVAACLFQVIVKSPHWRRTLWQVSLISLGGLLVWDIAGMDPWTGMVHRRFSTRETPGASAPLVNARTRSAVGMPESAGAKEPGNVVSTASSLSQASVPDNAPDAAQGAATNLKSEKAPLAYLPEGRSAPADREWVYAIIVALWSAGTVLVFLRIVVSWVMLWMFRRRCLSDSDPALRDSALNLASALGLRGDLRLITGLRLSGPISFGIWRATIALPANFTSEYDAGQREAILAHEIAHLAGRDPVWRLLADFVCAALWWHPLAWWARRQLHMSCELVADEASQLVYGGPANLACCLVELGKKQIERGALASVGMAGSGFRSALGQRVRRLLHMEGGWNPPSLERSVMARVAGPVLLVAFFVLGASWASPRLTGGALTRPDFGHSFSVLAIIAGAGLEPRQALQAGTSFPDSSWASAEAAASGEGGDTRGASSVERKATASNGDENKSVIADKLKSIVFEEITFNNMPLQAAIKQLGDKIRQSDPEKIGVNFLISGSRGRGMATDRDSFDQEQISPEARRAGIEKLNQLALSMDDDIKSMKERLANLRGKQYATSSPAWQSKLRLFPEAFLSARRLIIRLTISAQAEMVKNDRLLEQLASYEKSMLLRSLPTAVQDAVLLRLISQRSQLNQELAAARNDYAESHPNVKQLKESMALIDSEIDIKTAAILEGLKIKRVMLKSLMDALRKELDETGGKKPEPSALVPDSEYLMEQELASIQKKRAKVLLRIEEETDKLELSNKTTTAVELIEKILARQGKKVKELREQFDRMTAEAGVSAIDRHIKDGKQAEETMGQIQTNIVCNRVEMVKNETLLAALNKLEPSQLRRQFPVLHPDPLLSDLLAKAGEAQIELARQRRDFTDQHPKVTRVKQLAVIIDAQIGDRVNGILVTLRDHNDALKSQNESLLQWQSDVIKMHLENTKRSEQLKAVQRDLEMQQTTYDEIAGRLETLKIDEAFNRGNPQKRNGAHAKSNGSRADSIDLKSVRIDFSQPLRNARAIDVLDAITRTAIVPLAYLVQDYGVIIMRE